MLFGIHILSVPYRVLVLHLKRFQFSPSEVKKLNHHVFIPKDLVVSSNEVKKNVDVALM